MENIFKNNNWRKLFFGISLSSVLTILIIIVLTILNAVSCGINELLDLSSCSVFKEVFIRRQEVVFKNILDIFIGTSLLSAFFVLLIKYEEEIDNFLKKIENQKKEKQKWKIQLENWLQGKVGFILLYIVKIFSILYVVFILIVAVYISTLKDLCI